MLNKEFPSYTLLRGFHLQEVQPGATYEEDYVIDSADFKEGSEVQVLAEVKGTDFVVIYSDDIQEASVVIKSYLKGYE